MKPLVATGGIGLIAAPVLYFLTFEQRASQVRTKDEVVGLLGSIPAGLMMGFIGLMILGFLCDGGQGFKPLWLLSVMLLLGFAWSLIYPSGWMLGIPLVLYSGEKLFRAARTKTDGANKTLDTKT